MPSPALYPVALTIAGSDSSGGAGLQADLKTFASLEVYGASVVTAVTAQSTVGVRGVHLVPPALVAGQIDAVLEDLPVAAAKIGMLGGAGQVAAVADSLPPAGTLAVVLDPVMVATSGDRLLDPDAVSALAERLLPRADLVTPNLPEARLLAGLPGAPAADLAAALRHRGARAVLVKGGHGEGDEIEDVLEHQGGRQVFRHPRLATACTHGTGCTLSAAVAAGLARGQALPAAVASALDYLHEALRQAWPLGAGHGPVHHFHRQWRRPA